MIWSIVSEPNIEEVPIEYDLVCAIGSLVVVYRVIIAYSVQEGHTWEPFGECVEHLHDDLLLLLPVVDSEILGGKIVYHYVSCDNDGVNFSIWACFIVEVSVDILNNQIY